MSIQSINYSEKANKYYPLITISLITLLYIRLLAGIADGFSNVGGAQLSSILFMSFVCLLLVRKMSIPRDTLLWFFSFLTLMSTMIASAYYNDVLAGRESISFTIQLFFYTILTPISFSYLRTNNAILSINRFSKFYLIISGILVAYQISTGDLHYDQTGIREGRAYGSASHPVPFGIQVTSALVILEISRLKLGKPVDPIFLLCIAIGGFCLYESQARSAWLMAAIILGYYLSLHRSKTLKYLMISIFSLVAGISIIGSDRFSDLSTLGDFFRYTDFSSGTYDFRFVDNSLSWRFSNWYLMIDSALQKPALGFGPGQVKEISLFELEAHNLIIEILVQGGLLAVISLMGIFISIWILYNKCPDESAPDKNSKSLLKVYLLTLLMVSLFGASLVYQTMTILFMIISLSIASYSSGISVGKNESE